jgi:hypothetical protein
MRKLLFAVTVALLPGIALAETQQVWIKAGGTNPEFAGTRHDCMLEASRYPIKIGDTIIPNGQLFTACMQAHGWHLGPGTPMVQ